MRAERYNPFPETFLTLRALGLPVTVSGTAVPGPTTSLTRTQIVWHAAGYTGCGSQYVNVAKPVKVDATLYLDLLTTGEYGRWCTLCPRPKIWAGRYGVSDNVADSRLFSLYDVVSSPFHPRHHQRAVRSRDVRSRVFRSRVPGDAWGKVTLSDVATARAMVAYPEQWDGQVDNRVYAAVQLHVPAWRTALEEFYRSDRWVAMQADLFADLATRDEGPPRRNRPPGLFTELVARWRANRDFVPEAREDLAQLYSGPSVWVAGRCTFDLPTRFVGGGYAANDHAAGALASQIAVLRVPSAAHAIRGLFTYGEDQVAVYRLPRLLLDALVSDTRAELADGAVDVVTLQDALDVYDTGADFGQVLAAVRAARS